MKLLTYAVSQKLNNNNDMWRFVKENKPIPVDVVENAFLETLENYSDIKAERLVTSYKDFVTHHIPVTFVPNENGVQVSGEIQEEALEVIESLYAQTPEDVIKETIESSIHTISADREIDITDLEIMASELQNNVRETHKRVEQLTKAVIPPIETETPRKQEDIKLVDEAPARIILEERQTPLDKAAQAIAEAEQNEATNDIFEIPEIMKLDDLPELDELPEIPELDEPTIQPVDDIKNETQSSDEEPIEVVDNKLTDTGLLASVWNSFVADIKAKDLDNRLNLETPMTLAVV